MADQYGPPAPPPKRSPAAREAYAVMRRTRGTRSPEEHSAAARFLRAILGPAGPVPPNWTNRWFERPDYIDEMRGSQLNLQENLDPQIEAAYSAVARQYPQAAKNVYGLYQVLDYPRSDTAGEYTEPWGNMGLRTKMHGEPIPFRKMIDYAKHEFAHARGLDDVTSDRNRIRSLTDLRQEFDAYDVSDAADTLRQDINLPYEGPPLVTGRQVSKPKAKLQARRR